MMTSRERLDRCFRRQETDRPGLFMRGVGENAPPHPSYRPLRELVLEKCDLKSLYYFGDHKDRSARESWTEPHNEEFERQVTVVHTPKGDLRECFMRGLLGQPGYTEKHLIETPEEAERYLSLPAENFVFDPEDFFALDRKIGDRGVAVADLGFNPAGAVAELLGSELFAWWSIDERDLLCALMEKERDVLLANVRALIESGIGPYFGMLGEEYITPPLHGVNDFYEFNVVYDKPIADLIHNAGGLLHIHSHGPLKDVLPYFIELGADVLHPIEAPPMGNVTLREAKEVLRGRVCIEGNIQIGDMYEKEPEDIRAQAREIIRDGFDDRTGLIVCPTASPFVPEMSERVLENYRTLIETVLNRQA